MNTTLLWVHLPNFSNAAGGLNGAVILQHHTRNWCFLPCETPKGTLGDARAVGLALKKPGMGQDLPWGLLG